MFKKIREKVKKGLRRASKRQNYDIDESRPNRLHSLPPKRLQRAALPKGIGKLAAAPNPKAPSEAEAENDKFEEEDQQEEVGDNKDEGPDDNDEDEDNVSENGNYDGGDDNDGSEDNNNDSEEDKMDISEDNAKESEDDKNENSDSDGSEDYPPLPSSPEGSYDHHANQSDSEESSSSAPSNNDDDDHDHNSGEYLPLTSSSESDGYSSRSDDDNDHNSGDYPPLPSSSESDGYSPRSDGEGYTHPPLPRDPRSRTSSDPATEHSNVSNEGSSGEEFYSVRSRVSNTGITPEMSDVDLSDRDSYHSAEYHSHGGHGSGNAISDQWNSEDSEGPHEEFIENVNADQWNPEDSEESDEQFIENVEQQRSGRKRARPFDDAEGEVEVGMELQDMEPRPDSTARGNTKRARRDSDSPFRPGRLRKPRPEIPDLPQESDVTRYRNRGARYQAWIDNPNEPDCPVQRSTANLDTMTDANQEYPWEMLDDVLIGEPMQFAGGETDTLYLPRGLGVRYRYTNLLQHIPPEELRVNNDQSSYTHRTSRGVIVGENIFRWSGLHWNEVAQALYENHYMMNTLRYIVFTDIANDQTNPYIRYELYPNMLGIFWRNAGDHPAMIFEHDNAQYQELLGTTLGRAAASLVLAAFPRGTMRIARIVTWSHSTSPQMRFELEPIIPEPVALPPAA